MLYLNRLTGLTFACLLLVSNLVTADVYEEQDRFESFNRVMFDFNDSADKYLVKPVAQAYKFITPKLVNEGVTNFFNNLGDVETFANSLLQAKLNNAMITLYRVIYNSSFGLGGLIDVATHFGLKNNQEDFGQTLAYWGYENSSYLMLPFLGPSTVRDLTGRAIDIVYDPLLYFDQLSDDVRWLSLGVELVDKRADLLGAENLLLGMDRYQFVRSAYFQNREFLIKDGEIDDPFANESFEDFEDF